jgi:hypothetical protein
MNGRPEMAEERRGTATVRNPGSKSTRRVNVADVPTYERRGWERVTEGPPPVKKRKKKTPVVAEAPLPEASEDA